MARPCLTLRGHPLLTTLASLRPQQHDSGFLPEEQDPSLGYSTLFESREKEKQWVVECLDLLANFVTLERESGPDREGDPEHLEFRMT